MFICAHLRPVFTQLKPVNVLLFKIHFIIILSIYTHVFEGFLDKVRFAFFIFFKNAEYTEVVIYEVDE
jgi:hypothetical protein